MKTTKTVKHYTDKKVGIIWTRVSTKEQAENNLSLDTQRKACIEYAEKHGIEIDRIMGDTNESAKTAGKGFKEMIKYVSQNRHINTILCYSYDRFSRTGYEAMGTKEYLKQQGINLISVTQPIDDGNASGEFMQSMMFLFSQFENNLRKDKCMAGMIACLENGDWYSQPPIGYSIDKSAAKKHTLYINETGKKLRQAFMWKATEEISNAEIVKRLKALGVNLDKKRMTEIFYNPFYCGKIRHKFLGDKIVKGNHPALVSEEIWNKINNRGTSGRINSMELPEVPLRQHVKCKECGGYLTAYKQKDYWYYKCNTVGCKCNISARKIHEKYSDMLKEYMIPEYMIPIIEESIRKILKAKYANDMVLTSDLETRMTQLDKKMEEVMLKYGLGDIPEDVYNITYRTLTKQKSDINIQLTEAKSNESNLEKTAHVALVTSCKLETLWNKGSYDNKQKIQNLVYPEGIYWDKVNKCYRTIKENESLRIIRTLSSSYEEDKIKTEEKPCDFSSVVAPSRIELLSKV